MRAGWWTVDNDILRETFHLPEDVRILGAEGIAGRGYVRFFIESDRLPDSIRIPEVVAVFDEEPPEAPVFSEFVLR